MINNIVLDVPTTPIPNFSRYTIDINGNVWSKTTKKFMKPSTTHSGLKTIRLINNDKGIELQYHHFRIVPEILFDQTQPTGCVS